MVLNRWVRKKWPPQTSVHEVSSRGSHGKRLPAASDHLFHELKPIGASVAIQAFRNDRTDLHPRRMRHSLVIDSEIWDPLSECGMPPCGFRFAQIPRPRSPCPVFLSLCASHIGRGLKTSRSPGSSNSA
jgi:hypothetical protein